MTNDSPKPSCEHDNDYRKVWINERGGYQPKEDYPECPFCKPRQESGEDVEEIAAQLIDRVANEPYNDERKLEAEISDALRKERERADAAIRDGLQAYDLMQKENNELQEKLAAAEKCIEERGYAFQEAQNRTLLKNYELEARVKELVEVAKHAKAFKSKLEAFGRYQGQHLNKSLDAAEQSWAEVSDDGMLDFNDLFKAIEAADKLLEGNQP